MWCQQNYLCKNCRFLFSIKLNTLLNYRFIQQNAISVQFNGKANGTESFVFGKFFYISLQFDPHQVISVRVHISKLYVSVCRLKMLWVDKHRPKTLEQILVHEDVAQNLKKLVCNSVSPFFFYNVRIWFLFLPLLICDLCFHCIGDRARLPAFALLRAIWVRQENSNNGSLTPDIRTQCWQGWYCLLRTLILCVRPRKENIVISFVFVLTVLFG